MVSRCLDETRGLHAQWDPLPVEWRRAKKKLVQMFERLCETAGRECQRLRI